MTQLSDAKIMPECEDLDLSHGLTRLLAAALYWRRTAVARKERADALEAALRELNAASLSLPEAGKNAGSAHEAALDRIDAKNRLTNAQNKARALLKPKGAA